MFFKIAFSRDVVFSALRVSLVVGTLLAFINHSDAIMSQQLLPETIVKILLSYMVPYGVATYSAVRAIQANR